MEKTHNFIEVIRFLFETFLLTIKMPNNQIQVERSDGLRFLNVDLCTRAEIRNFLMSKGLGAIGTNVALAERALAFLALNQTMSQNPTDLIQEAEYQPFDKFSRISSSMQN